MRKMIKRAYQESSSLLRKFRDDVHGGMTALTCVVFLIMVVSVGMAVDFMRHETHRAELQDALDRGVLAAAAFSQTLEAEETVRGYLKSTTFVKDDYTLDVQTATTTGSRTITATATYPVDTFFLKIIGINQLDIAAKGVAVEGASKIEISLVLDISTSMAIEDVTFTESGVQIVETRLENLKSSASGFIDSVFSANNGGDVTVSLIPFGGQVNVGPVAFNYLNGSTNNPDAGCVEFADLDFDTTQTPSYQSLSQMQYFNFSQYETGGIAPAGVTTIDWGWCPSDAQRIEYFSSSPTGLKARINGLRTHEATGTQYGMKYANMLLDPDANALTQVLEQGGVISGSKLHLPRPFTDTEVQKYIIIMSDGDTTPQARIKAQHYLQDNGDGVVQENETAFWANNLPGSHSQNWNVFEEIIDMDTSRDQFKAACKAARDNQIYIFAIGFDVAPGSNAETDLKDCVKNNGGEYHDTESGLAKTFDQIASTIQKLRLVY